PALETVLARALAREPAARHPDMAGFAEALAGAAPPAPAPVQRDGLEGFLAAMLEDIGLDGTLFRQGLPQAPFCSVNFGAGGIAYGLYRLAGRRDDARLLAAAEAWIMVAARDADGERAFANPEMDLSETTVGRISPYHARPGLPLVQAMIAEAAGEEALRDAAANAYLAAIEQPCAERDLTLGRAGAVLGSALLLELLPASG